MYEKESNLSKFSNKTTSTHYVHINMAGLLIAKKLNQRTGKQCRERWANHLDTTINRGEWTEEEDRMLIQVQREKGNRWAEVGREILPPTNRCARNKSNI